MTQKTKTPKIDWDFFENVIAYNSLKDETYLSSIIDVAKPGYFKNNDIKIVFEILTGFFAKRNTIPTNSEIKAYLSSDREKSALKNVLRSFQNLDKKFNPEELYENTERFLKERAVYTALMETVDECSKDELDIGETYDRFDDACGISIIDNLGYDYFNDIDRHIESLKTVNTYVPTGWSWLNKMLGGGFLASGRSLYIFSGVTNVGKSIVLGNVATNVLAENKNVVLISLEMSEDIYNKRLSSQITGIPMDELVDNTAPLKEFVLDYKEKHPDANLYVKEFPPRSVTVNHIRAYLKKLTFKKKMKPDVIVIDYINLLRPSHLTGGSYEDLKTVTEELRALSYLFETPIISATQLNREAYGNTNPGLETQSESMGLAHTADAQIAIWCGEEDKELGIIHLGMQKNRFGPNHGTQAFRIDYDTLTITECPGEFYDDNDEVETLSNSLAVFAK
jgi:replicative DNA helicase